MTVDKKLDLELDRRQFLVASGTVTTAVVLGSCDNSSGKKSNNLNNINNLNNLNNLNNHNNQDGGVDGDADVVDPPVPRPATTVNERITGVLEPVPHFEDLRSLFGLTKKIPGEPRIHRDDFGAAALASGATQVLSSLAYFVHISDVHIIDEESPARSIHSPLAEGSAWRPQEQWSCHMLNAAIRTINQFAEVRPHDFVVFSGDFTDNIHWIELDWFIRILEGQLVDPDTGADDDPREPGLPDPHDPFQAAGLDPAVDWYCVLGNHDLLVLGNFDTLDFWVANPTGDKATIWISGAVIPTCFDEPPCINNYCYDDTLDRCHVPHTNSHYSSRDLVPDPRRRFANRMEYMSTIMGASRNGPSGHGFTQDNLVHNHSYWVKEEAVPGFPIAMVGLDTSSSGGVTASSKGYMSNEQLLWLQNTLADLTDRNKLIVVVSHHCSRDLTTNSTELVAALNACPNVILHCVGHHHEHQIMPRPAPDGMDPWHGYYEVQTTGLLDWPQQMRFWEIVDCGDGTGILYSTVVDLDIPPGDTAEGGRFYALLDIQEGRADYTNPGTPEHRNVALRIVWPPDMVPVLAEVPRRDVETLHFDNA